MELRQPAQISPCLHPASGHSQAGPAAGTVVSVMHDVAGEATLRTFLQGLELRF